YYDWMIKSANGKSERAAKNNHGSWYDVQAVQIALCLGKKDEAKRMLESAWRDRILEQVKSDGSMPLELARTKSFNYCSMNLDALTTLANFGEHVGVDLWKKNLKEGKCLRKAIDFMVPYIDKPAKKWTYEQIKDASFVDKLHILRMASLAYDTPVYENILSKYDERTTARLQFLFMK
ncbi:MAG: alginate lyase family protein, partial [bacterium]